MTRRRPSLPLASRARARPPNARRYVELVFTLIFTCECLAKFFGFGLVARTPSGQWTLGLFWSEWNNIKEVVVLSLCWWSVYYLNQYCVGFDYSQPEQSQKQYLAYSHMFRALRAFRLIGYVPQLQSMMHAFAFAISSVFWVITLVLLFLYICAVIATDLLGGQSREWCDALGGADARRALGSAGEDAHDDGNLDNMCARARALSRSAGNVYTSRRAPENLFPTHPALAAPLAAGASSRRTTASARCCSRCR